MLGEQEDRSAEKPLGGFRFITVVQLCLAWFAYRTRRIRFIDLRVYFACHELVARRCCLERGRDPAYGFAELGKLLGGGGEGPARLSVRRLEKAGLLTWSAEELRFASSPEQLACEELGPFWAILEQVQNNRRKVPVPRRIIRLIAGGARQVVVATILGHLLRCLYYRDGRCEPSGTCKASWVSKVFGVNESTVKEARGHLEALGWLLPVAMPQWHLNRYGKTETINLAWDRGSVPQAVPAAEASPPPEPQEVGSRPPSAQIPTGSRPPESDRNPLSGSENQKPAVPAGRPGFSAPTEKVGEPTLRHVVPQDLAETGRLLVLFDQASKEGLIGSSERDRLTFVAAAEHAQAVGSRNPCGLFATLVRKGLWAFITEGDDDAAHRRLKTHLYGDPRERTTERETSAPASVMSDDARFARAVRQVLRQKGFAGDAFTVVSQARPEWTRERWDAAQRELDESILGIRQERTIADTLGTLLPQRAGR